MMLKKGKLSIPAEVGGPYEHMECSQEIPCEHSADDDFARRRTLMRPMMGILPSDVTLAEAREGRLARKDC